MIIKRYFRRTKRNNKEFLKEDMDYQLFLRMVKTHRVYPLVYKNLSEIIDIDISEKVISDLGNGIKRILLNQ